MPVKYMVGIRNRDTKEFLGIEFGTSVNFAIRKYRSRLPDSEAFNTPLEGEWVTTPEGYCITELRYLKKGEYFIVVDSNHRKVGKTVYVKDVYDHSREKYECYKFSDICACRYFHASQLVTDEMTF